MPVVKSTDEPADVIVYRTDRPERILADGSFVRVVQWASREVTNRYLHVLVSWPRRSTEGTCRRQVPQRVDSFSSTSRMTDEKFITHRWLSQCSRPIV